MKTDMKIALSLLAIVFIAMGIVTHFKNKRMGVLAPQPQITTVETKLAGRVEGDVKGALETRLSVNWQNAPLGRVLEELSSLSGTPVRAEGSISQDWVSITQKDATVLNILRDIGLSRNVSFLEGDEYCLIHTDNLWRQPTSDAGWAMVFARQARILAERHAVFANHSFEQFSIALDVLAERDRYIVWHSGGAKVVEAVTDVGESLIVDELRDLPGKGFSRSIMTVGAVMKVPRGGNTLKSLKGSFEVALEKRFQTWTIEDPLSAPKQTRTLPGGDVLSFESSEKGQWLALSVGANREDAPEVGYPPELLTDRMTLLDAHGNSITHLPKVLASQAGEGKQRHVGWIVWRYEINQNRPRPSSLTLQIPTAIEVVTVPFEFHDLQIP